MVRKKNIFIVIFILLVCNLFLVFVDYSRVKHGYDPIFSIKVDTDDENEFSYLGFLYRFKYTTNRSDDVRVRFTYFIISFDVVQDVDNDIRLEGKKTTFCNKKRKLYYSTRGQDFYTYCLDEVYVRENGNRDRLDDYLYINGNIDDLITSFDIESEYWDGGSILYKNKDMGMAILMCHTVDKNNDVYIGPYDMKYEETFCKDKKDIDDELFK